VIQIQLKRLAHALLYFAFVRRFVESIPALGKRTPPWARTHSFDRKHGIDTSGFVGVDNIVSDKTLAPQINAYAGSQPSIIRAALSALEPLERYTFIDVGCGKGRAMLVASEFPFRGVQGVELSPQLVKIARDNIAKVKRRFPTRPPTTVSEGNAMNLALPEGDLALFFYHPFGPELVSQFVRKLETRLATCGGHIFCICVNPVYGNLIDASPAFRRWYAQTLPYDQTELGFGPDTEDSVVIWQSVEGARPTPHPYPNRPIVSQFSWRAELGQ
jgi:SAM-dependent methyltransferase